MTDGQHGNTTNILLTVVNELVFFFFTAYCMFYHLTYLVTGMFVYLFVCLVA